MELLRACLNQVQRLHVCYGPLHYSEAPAYVTCLGEGYMGIDSLSCSPAGGQLFMWGKLKNNGDDWMYPKPLMDLRFWPRI